MSSPEPNSKQMPELSPLEVPVFNCIIYMAPKAGGGIKARVANLAGHTCEAASEREALAKIVPGFKKQVRELAAKREPIPWIEPPLEQQDEEEVRFVPVHL